MVSATSEQMIPEAIEEITQVLKERHRLGPSEDPDFTIRSQSDIASTATATSSILTTLLASIASISLLVGGIGIMNIMLVTVTERTREIGLRKALGAKRKTVIMQFLVEAIILTLTGGIIGMGLGIGISYLLSKNFSLPFTVSASSVLLALVVSGGIGIIFGWYPARRAAGLQPIEALRYE
jgi:putative ABC transport system permease protein